MAYREVRRMDIDQIIRRWLAGEKIRAIARATGADRNTVRRIVRIADKEGIGRAAPWPDEGKLQAIRQRMGRPGPLHGATLVPSSASSLQLRFLYGSWRSPPLSNEALIIAMEEGSC